MFAALRNALAIEEILDPIALTVPALELPVFAALAIVPPGVLGALITLPLESVGNAV